MIDRYHALMASVRREAPLLAMAMVEHRNLRGQPMSFGDMPYLAPLYERIPKTTGVDIISGVQTGKSELFILNMLHLAGWQGRICAYILPTYALRNRFVSRRIDPLVTTVPAYAKRLPGGEANMNSKGSLSAKRFGAGTMMFLGSNTATDFLEFSADTLFIDEYDACDQDNLVKARDRILASPYPQMFRLGNPQIPGQGIDRLYQRSDRRRWFYRCPHCNEAQPLDWQVNFVRRRDDGTWEPRDRERAGGQSRLGGKVIPFQQGITIDAMAVYAMPDDLRPVCRRCDRPFERRAAWYAWVAENPGQGMREGYRMTRLDILTQSIRALFAEWIEAQSDSAKLARFFASNLGIAYEHAAGQLSVEVLQDACRAEENDLLGNTEKYKDCLIVMGVDVGTVLNVTIDEIRMVSPGEAKEDAEHEAPPGLTRVSRHIGAYSSFDDLKDLVGRFAVQVLCIDARPETRKCQELRDDLMQVCDVWLCQFTAAPRVGRQRFGMQLDWQTKVVSVDRTQLLDAAFDDIRFKRRRFPLDAMSIPGWSDQMRAPKRKLDEGKTRMIWDEGNDPDHFRMADGYALVAMELAGSGGTYSSG